MKEEQIGNASQKTINNNFLIIIFGLPASGKSTFAAFLQENLFPQALAIYADKIEYKSTKKQLTYTQNNQEALSFFRKLQNQKCKKAKFHAQFWKESRKFIQNNVPKLIQKTPIILQDDLLLRSQRRVYRKISWKKNIQYLQILMDSSSQQCLKNLKKRKKSSNQQAQIDQSIISKAEEKLQIHFDEQSNHMIKLGLDNRFKISRQQILSQLRVVNIRPNDPNDPNFQMKTEEPKQIIHTKQEQIQIMTKSFVGYILKLSTQELIQKLGQGKVKALQLDKKAKLSAILQKWKKQYVKSPERTSNKQFIEDNLIKWINKY